MSNQQDDDNGSDVDDLIRQQEFGSYFRKARESTGMSIYDVSNELKLPEDIIKALENSQVSALPASAYTQGYIRNYARLLNLSAEDIIKAYTDLLPEKEKPLSARSVLPSQKTSRDSTVKFVTYSMFLMGLVLLVIWWYQADFNWLENGEINKTGQVDEGQQQQLLHQVKDAEVKKLLPAKSGQQDNLRNKEIIKQELEVNKKEVVVESKKIEEKISDQSNSVNLFSGDDVVVLYANSDSWVQVQDANSNRLYFELIKKDKTERLIGLAPFRVFLGNAPAVEIQLNNINIDITKYIRSNNVAHIALSKDGSVVNVRKQKQVITDTKNNQSGNDEKGNEIDRPDISE